MCAYYDCSCDSHGLFDDKEIARTEGYPDHLNRYYVINQYLKVEELLSGKGIADVVYLPKPKSLLPALVVELRWNKSSEGAIRQIKENDCPAVLKDYDGEVVIIGISYDSKKKEHSCVIERV